MSYIKMIEDELEHQVSEMKRYEVGSKEYETAAKAISVLHNIIQESKKLEIDTDMKNITLENEYDVKSKQADENKRNRLWNTVVEIGGIVIPAVITIWGTKTTLRFEADGTPTSITSRSILPRLFKK